jgi:hypothetical protein
MTNKLVVVLVGLLIAVAWRVASHDMAPVTAGTFLVYDVSGSVMRLTFSPAYDDRFATTYEFADERGTFGSEESVTSQGKVVTTRMRTESGAIFEVGSLGPLWVPPRQLHEGGNANGARVSEVRRWKEWDVGVVTASVGVGGAFRGEWFYDTLTGFLVGETKSTALSGPGEGQVFTLTDSNVPSPAP